MHRRTEVIKNYGLCDEWCYIVGKREKGEERGKWGAVGIGWTEQGRCQDETNYGVMAGRWTGDDGHVNM